MICSQVTRRQKTIFRGRKGSDRWGYSLGPKDPVSSPVIALKAAVERSIESGPQASHASWMVTSTDLSFQETLIFMPQ